MGGVEVYLVFFVVSKMGSLENTVSSEEYGETWMYPKIEYAPATA